MALVGLDGRWLQVNDALCDLTGYTKQELLTKGFQEITHPDDLPRDAEHARRLREGEIKSYQMEKRFIHADGHPVWVSFNASLVRVIHGDPLYLITQVEDISELKHLEEELYHQAQHDSLTGLFNRRRFEQELDRQLAYAQRYGSGGAVMVFDLDNFKDINDRHGHAAGDEVLRKVASAIRKTLRGTDTSARLGGDEFAIILPETDAAGAERVARRLLESVRQLRTAARASIGIALFESPVPAYRHDPLVLADEAMYEAKRAGGDRYVTRTAPVASS